MKTWYARILVTGGAAVLVAALGVPAALGTVHGGPWIIQPGGAFEATAGTTTVTDKTSGQTITCTSSAISGTLNSGSGLSGTHAGALTSVTFANCTLGGMTLALQASGPPWYMNLLGWNSGDNVLFGMIKKINIAVSSPACSFVIDGRGAIAHDGRQWFRYRDRTGKLLLEGVIAKGFLRAYDVSGCTGAISDGDAFMLGAKYTVTPKQDIYF